MRKIITILLLFSILLLNLPLAKSNSQGPNSPRDIVDDSSSGGDRSWSNPRYAEESDNRYATVYAGTGKISYSHYLRATAFRFSIPSGATINGILVEIERHASVNNPTAWVKDWKVYLLKAGSVVGDNKADTTNNWPTSDAYKSYGGSNDLWGTTWTPSDINNANFGVVLAVQMPGSLLPPPQAYVDHIRITVYYSVNNPPEIKNEYPANASVSIPIKPMCHVYVEDADGDLITVRFYENTTGSWVLRQTNYSVSSGSTVYWKYTQAEEPETTYWWKVEATDGTDTTTKIFHFTTEAKPTIIFAGNPGDKGGPYCIPPTDNITTGGPYAMEGYYTNDSYQEEDWIYINITSSPGKDIYLHWYDATTDTWDNSTSYKFIETGSAGSGKSYYEFNTSGNITITPGHKYSFDVVQNTFIVRWEKIGADDKLTRRYVYLGCTPDNDNFEYKPFYCYNASYSQDAIDNHHLRDILHHDQGIDGTVNDTGYLLDGIPTDDIQYRHCSIFMGFWFDETVAISNITLENIYQHFWWNVSFWTSAGWNKSRDRLDNTITDGYVPTPIANTSISCCGYTFNLSCHKIVLSNPVTITDNNVYEICGLKLYASYPKVVSNRSFTSFVIFNVPDNSTLQTLDTDNDGLNDYQELYVYYTNPFLADTDNDGYSDYNEINAGTNPNVYTDYPVNQPPSLTNPSATPSTGVEDYTVFYFNITYSDPDGDAPVEIKVNISKTGWYINATMTYISGDNTTGALYSYSTTLSAGVYDYLFYASDGIASTVNDPTDQVTVMGQSISFTVSTADPSGQENFTASAIMGAEWNVSASYQTSSIPAIQITNTGNVPINITINLTSMPISNVHIKYNTSSTPPSFTTDPYSCDNELTTTPVYVFTLQPSDTGNIWLWADFENKYNPGEYTTSLWIESSSAT